MMVDAEQTYYQPGIRHIAVNVLMPKYNNALPVVYNTIQSYLKVRHPKRDPIETSLCVSVS